MARQFFPSMAIRFIKFHSARHGAYPYDCKDRANRCWATLLRLPSCLSPLGRVAGRGLSLRLRRQDEPVLGGPLASHLLCFCAFELAIASCTPLVAKGPIPTTAKTGRTGVGQPSPVSPLASHLLPLPSCVSPLASPRFPPLASPLIILRVLGFFKDFLFRTRRGFWVAIRFGSRYCFGGCCLQADTMGGRCGCVNYRRLWGSGGDG